MSRLDTRAIESKELPKAKAPEVRQGFRVFISEEAFDRATTRGQADLTREVGGILVGRLVQDEGGPFVSIETTIDALHAEEKGTELTFTHATWEHIHKEMDAKFQGRKILGWYHTHPGFGVFLSDRDLFIHQSFFNLPYQVALVYDPKSHAHGMFTWHENEPARCRRYWVGKEETLWDGARHNAAAEAPPSTSPSGSAPGVSEKKSEKGSTRPAAENDWDWFNVSAMGLAVLLVGGLLGFWGGQYMSRKAIEQAQVRLDQARLAAAQELLRVVNVELVSFVREFVGGEAFRVPFDEGLTQLDAGLDGLRRGGQEARALDDLAEGRRKLKNLRDAYVDADRALSQLERIGQMGGASSREVSRMLSEQRAALGQLYAEVAEDVAKGGDMSRARRLLDLAQTLDPGSARRYEEKRRELSEGGRP